ncbi:hypothetical protein DPMN_140763 [Dreissena polymorpha]|uniref:Uncharacterized protein n=1 Tax=Dreissena polymorpha TaxID=45954 RepID=A0A9D4G880_DREPO|nr:hypothetical protein DPMN_140763 [Dreissena polymorpha]
MSLFRIAVAGKSLTRPAPTPTTFDPGFQGSSANSVGGAGGQDGRTDAHHHNTPTFSPKNVGIIIKNVHKKELYNGDNAIDDGDNAIYDGDIAIYDGDNAICDNTMATVRQYDGDNTSMR